MVLSLNLARSGLMALSPELARSRNMMRSVLLARSRLLVLSASHGSLNRNGALAEAG